RAGGGAAWCPALHWREAAQTPAIAMPTARAATTRETTGRRGGWTSMRALDAAGAGGGFFAPSDRLPRMHPRWASLSAKPLAEPARRRTVMSWIRIAEPDVAPAESAPGDAPSALSGMTLLGRVLGVRKPAKDALAGHERSLLRDPSALTPAQLELVAVVVSATNG